MSCCTNTYDLGCFESCEFVTSSITVSQTGIFTIRLLPRLVDLVEFDRSNGQSLVIPNEFNEDGVSQFQIINPDDSIFTYTEDGVTYDCFQIKNRISSNPSLIPVGGDCDPATANAYNSDLDLLATASIPSGAIGNLNIQDTPASAVNSALTVIGSANLPSGVAGNVSVADFTLTINDQDGVNLFTGNKASGINITQAVTVDKTTVIQFPFDLGTDTSGLVTITAYNAGTYTAANANTTDDGASGTITYSINGGAYAAFPASQVLVASDTVQAKRTITTAAGYSQIGGTYT